MGIYFVRRCPSTFHVLRSLFLTRRQRVLVSSPFYGLKKSKAQNVSHLHSHIALASLFLLPAVWGSVRSAGATCGLPQGLALIG